MEKSARKRGTWEGKSGWSQALSRTNISSRIISRNTIIAVTIYLADAIEAALEGEEDTEYTKKEMQAETHNKQKGFNRLSCNDEFLFQFHVKHIAVVSDLLMSEVIANYARKALEKNEDSGVESANSFDNTGEETLVIVEVENKYISGSEINSEFSSHEDFTEHKVTVHINNKDMDEQ